MTNEAQWNSGTYDFESTVLPAEQEEIRLRREAVGLPPPAFGGERGAPAAPTAAKKSTARKTTAGTTSSRSTPKTDPTEVTGLALSGGGIRSAAFGLGVLQSLIRHDELKRFDYLSTVSGGGFIGSCVSALMHGDRSDGESGSKLLVPGEATAESRASVGGAAALDHLRNGSNYLVPPGAVNRLRLPGVFVVGLLQVLALALPVVVMLVLATEIFFDFTARLQVAEWRTFLSLICAVPLLFAAILRPLTRTLGGRSTSWGRRDKADRRLGWYFFAAALGVLAMPVIAVLQRLVDEDAASIKNALSGAITHQIQLGLGGWLVWASLGLFILLVVGLFEFREALVLALLAAVGPVVLGGLYIILCIWAINSAVVPAGDFPELRDALHGARDPSSVQGFVLSETAQAELEALMHKKGIEFDHYEEAEPFAISRPVKGSITGFGQLRPEEGARVRHLNWMRKSDAPASLFLQFMTTGHSRTVTVHLSGSSHGSEDIVVEELSILSGHAEWTLYLAAFLLLLFNYFLVDVNQISLHTFYRDRLSATFLIEPGRAGVTHTDRLKLSELRASGSGAPYHLLNTALNLQGSSDLDLRDRKTAPFLFSKLYCGSDQTGYCKTEDLERRDEHIDLGTAMAVSAAAAAPNMGTIHKPQIRLALTVLNVRIGYWVRNPRLVASQEEDAIRRNARPGLWHIFKEAIGMLDENGRFVNCTDGGHIENLGVYELLRRKCRTIVCVDAEADKDFSFNGLTTLQRYAKIDLNTDIRISVEALRQGQSRGTGAAWRRVEGGDGPTSKSIGAGVPWTEGTIEYADGTTGKLIYVKLGMIEHAPEYLRYYAEQSKDFPHEGTGDQFFDETQFEVYRELGQLVAERVFAEKSVRSSLEGRPGPDEA